MMTNRVPNPAAKAPALPGLDAPFKSESTSTHYILQLFYIFIPIL